MGLTSAGLSCRIRLEFEYWQLHLFTSPFVTTQAYHDHQLSLSFFFPRSRSFCSKYRQSTLKSIAENPLESILVPRPRPSRPHKPSLCMTGQYNITYAPPLASVWRVKLPHKCVVAECAKPSGKGERTAVCHGKISDSHSRRLFRRSNHTDRIRDAIGDEGGAESDQRIAS